MHVPWVPHAMSKKSLSIAQLAANLGMETKMSATAKAETRRSGTCCRFRLSRNIL